MKENVLDVLMYLFENYIYDEPETTPDRETLADSLSEAGFTEAEINKAFRWLDELTEQRDQPELRISSNRPVRVFVDRELDRLDTQTIDLLMYLENIGVLDAARRELVIDRLLALEDEEITEDDVKWVVLMVLFNQPGQEANYAWMEDYLFEDELEYKH